MLFCIFRKVPVERSPDSCELFKKVLGEGYLEIKGKSITIKENFDKEETAIELELLDDSKVSGHGVGAVDSFFNGLLGHFSKEFKSITSITLEKFHVSTRRESSYDCLGTSALCCVDMLVKNSNGKKFNFQSTTRSLTTSAAEVCMAAIEHFVNAEKSYIILWKCLKNASDRNRQDLVDRYTKEISEVVINTSYADTIRDLQEELFYEARRSKKAPKID